MKIDCGILEPTCARVGRSRKAYFRFSQPERCLPVPAHRESGLTPGTNFKKYILEYLSLPYMEPLVSRRNGFFRLYRRFRFLFVLFRFLLRTEQITQIVLLLSAKYMQ